YWNNGQTYSMAVICLVLGIAAGYLLHAPVAASAGSIPTSTSTTPPKRMADKQVAPLLEQLKNDPRDADLLAKIAHNYMAAQQFQSAQQYYEQSVAIRPKADALNELAFVYVKLGDLDKGIATL